MSEVIDLRQMTRNNMIRDICDGMDMAKAAYQYQTWTVNAVLDWLGENGYDIVKKAPHA